MSTYNICFHGEIRKIFCGYPLLSVAMGGRGNIFRKNKIDPDLDFLHVFEG